MSASINQGQTTEELRSDNVALRERVLMAEGTLDAIRRGEVDALVSQTPQGPRVFTLVDACSPYRTFVEEMQHGAATLSAEGTVLYCNRSLPVLLHAPAERIVGAAWQSLVAPESAADSARLLTWAARANSNAELTLRAADGQFVPVGVSAHPLTVDDVQTTCLVITDLSERKRAEEETRKLAALVKYTEDTFFCAGSANVERNNAFSRSAVASYAVAVLLVAVAFLSRWILWPVLGSESPFVLHWPALVFAAWYGGFRAGVLATVLSACGTAYFLMEPRFSLTVANAGARLGLCLFFGMGLALSLFVEKARQLKRAYLISDTQAQANLATSAYYRSLIEANLDPMVIKDKAGKITDLNRAAETATGRTRAELIGVEFTACFTDPDQARQLYQEAQQQGWVRDQPLEIRHRDGHTIPVLYNAALYRDLAGNVAGLVATLRDISERLKMDKELRRIEWLLGGAADSPAGRHTVDQPYGDLVQLNTSRLLADGAGATTLTDLTRNTMEVLETSAAIYEKNGDYALGLFSSGWCRFLDNASRKLCGTNDNRAALASGKWHCHESCWQASKDSIETGQPVDVECQGGIRLFAVPVRCGAEVVGSMNFGYGDPPREPHKLAEVAERYRVSVEELRQAASEYESRPTYLVNLAKERLKTSAAVVGAILEAKQARSQIEVLNRSLETRIAERTAELEAANKELEAFAYSVSHDLRSPLRAIDGFSQILLKEYLHALPDKPQHYLQVVCDNARQMGRLIDDLLRFSRSNRQAVQTQLVNPEEIVRHCLEELQPELDGRQVEIQIGALPPCWADASLLKQVWLNLLANALKYSRKRTPARIEIGSQVQDGETVYFVRDNGVGFDMQYAHKLFGVFQRLHAAEDYEGTGIGLALVQRILHRHGGRIWAQAAVDQGATFSFTLGRRPSHD